MHPTRSQAHARAVTTPTCTPGPHRLNLQHPAHLPPPAQPQPPTGRTSPPRTPAATALPGRTCANTPAPPSRRHPLAHSLPCLRPMRTWSRPHRCALPRHGLLLASTLARRHARPCAPARAAAQMAKRSSVTHSNTPTAALHPDTAAPSTCTYMLLILSKPSPAPSLTSLQRQLHMQMAARILPSFRAGHCVPPPAMLGPAEPLCTHCSSVPQVSPSGRNGQSHARGLGQECSLCRGYHPHSTPDATEYCECWERGDAADPPSPMPAADPCPSGSHSVWTVLPTASPHRLSPH